MLEEHGIIEGAFLYNIVRENMSKAQIKYLEEHPESHPYKNVAKFGGRDELTYPEKLLKETLLKNNITNFETNFPMRRYFYDFAFIKEKIDVEVDGPFHLFEERMASDKRRDKFSMDNGWTVMRFTAKKVIENPQLVVDDIMKVISACHNSV
jgi:very-short-patch-repair endonuclease